MHNLELLVRDALHARRPVALFVSPSRLAAPQPAMGVKADAARTAWARDEAKEREPGMPSPGADRSSTLRRLLLEGRP